MTPAPLFPLRVALAAAAAAATCVVSAQVLQATSPPSSAATVAQPAPGLRAEPVPPAVDTAFRAWDADHDNALSLAEFRNGWRALKGGARQTAGAGLRQQFDRLDANGNGGVDRVEYSDMVLIKRAGALAPPFSEADSNHSQKIEFDEYGALVRRLRAAQAGSAPSRRLPRSAQPAPDR